MVLEIAIVFALNKFFKHLDHQQKKNPEQTNKQKQIKNQKKKNQNNVTDITKLPSLSIIACSRILFNT